ncbi:MAG: hypothetical protein Cpurp_05190 [Chlorogloea purpurea SAG 13.99]|nr:hypothetical protein [Chlorogloea purpurea SAG 13.99]
MSSLLAQLVLLPVITPAQTPNSSDFNYFFTTGRVRSQQLTLTQQRPKDDNIPFVPSESWRLMVLKQGNALVWMPPGTIAQDNVNLNTIAGPMNFYTISSDSPERLYILAYGGQLTPAQLKQPKAILDAIKSRVAPAPEFKVTGDKEIKFQNSPGREFVLESETEIITIRAFLINSRAYVLGVRDSKSNPLPRQTNSFFNSFDLVSGS